MSFQLVSQDKCANCATDRTGSLSGLCNRCTQARNAGHIVKTKDTVEKDWWSCGCTYYSHGPTYCELHKISKNPKSTFP